MFARLFDLDLLKSQELVFRELLYDIFARLSDLDLLKFAMRQLQDASSSFSSSY